MRHAFLIACLVACHVILILESFAKPQFQARIPNGDNVPNWAAVGHVNPDASGGNARNPFGLDFHKEGNKWTHNLCLMDSDDDGKTNGEELGDPDCVWKVGDTPRVLVGITNPGIYNDFSKIVGVENDTLAPTPSNADGHDHSGPIQGWKVAHAIFMSLSFGLLLPVSTLFPFYMRNYRPEGKWREDHIKLMYGANSIGMLGFLIAIFSMGVESTLHGIIGVIVIVAVVVQASLGYYRQKVPSWMRWKLVHSLFGRSLVLLIALQVFLGYIELSEYLPVGAILIGLCHAGLIILAFVAVMRAFRKRALEAGVSVGDDSAAASDFAPLDAVANARNLQLT